MIIKVTCAIIQKGGTVLITQRSESMSQALLWEFPGGKLEAGESEEACLVREIEEELHITVAPLARLTPVRHQYGQQTIELIPYTCHYQKGAIRLAEHSDYHWVPPHALLEYDWCPADIPIVHEYLALTAL